MRRNRDRRLYRVNKAGLAIALIKDIGDVRKSARERATRRWNNLRIEREFKAAKKEFDKNEASKPKELRIGDVAERAR
jgi:hypothetical protein